MKRRVYQKFILCFLLMGLLFGCKERPLPPGTLASVNGELIHLNAVQALIDSRTNVLEVEPQPTVGAMEKTYREGVALLIAHTLVRQELAARDLAVSEGELNQAIARIKTDYGEEGMESFLADSRLREDEWRELMRDHLSLKVFMDRVLLPSIHISVAELKEYYNKRKDQLNQPEMWHICLKAGTERAEVENWCANLPTDTVLTDNCAALPSAEVPLPWGNELKKIKAPGCGRIIEQEGQWRSVAVLGQIPPRATSVAEVYPLLERNIREEKKMAAFEAWLSHKLESSKILIFSDLFPAEKNLGKD